MSSQNPINILFECSEEFNQNVPVKNTENLINFDFTENTTDFLINFIFTENLVEKQVCDSDTEPYMQSYLDNAQDFIDNNIKFEPILSITSERHTIYPIKFQSVWNNYKSQLKDNWVVQEVDFTKDHDHWENVLSNNAKLFLMHTLAFFGSFDSIVNCNIRKNLIDAIKIKEAECAYGKQFEMENVHGEMYSIMLDQYVKNEDLKEKLINAIKTMPSIQKKAAWCKKWIESDKTIAHKIIAFAIVEGVFFSGSFASIFWLKTLPGFVMPGLRRANKFIAKDENKHVELACIISGLLKNKLKESIVYEILSEAVEIEDEFINMSLPCRLLGMNSSLMSQYIKYVGDRLLVQLGYNKKYNVVNPFDFMKKIDSYVKDNFFDGRTDSYTDSKIDNPRVFKILEQYQVSNRV